MSVRFMLTALTAIIIAGHGLPVLAQNAEIIQLGVYTSDKASTMLKKFQPLLSTLESSIMIQMGKPVKLKLKIFRDYESALNALVEGSIDFVRFGPASYVLAKQKNAGIRLLAMEEKKGKKKFKGVIVVAKTSPIKSLGDLKGKSFAFGNQNSTIGRYLSQAELLKAGVSGSQLSKFEFLHRHDKVALAVSTKEFDAGAIKMGTFKKYHKKLNIIHEFDNVTKPWVGSASMREDMAKALSKALCTIVDKGILKKYKVSRFIPATDSEYDSVRAGMNSAKNFDSEK